MHPETPAGDSPGTTASALESIIAPWLCDRPSPEHWIETGAILRAVDAVEDALRTGAGAILVTGPSGHGKTTLIRWLWHHPPRGFATLFVPTLEVSEPNQIAARILATTRHSAVHDAEGALSRLLRAQSLRGAQPLLLADDLHEMPPATLAKLIGLCADSRVGVRVVAASANVEALDVVQRMLPQPVAQIAIDDSWTHADVERLIARIGASLPIGTADLLAAIDLSEALRTSNGNPRLVRAALAAQLRQLDLRCIEPIAPPPEPAAPPEPASFEPVVSEPVAASPLPSPEPVVCEPAAASPPPWPSTALVATRSTPLRAPPEAPPRPSVRAEPPQQLQRTTRSRVRRNRLWARAWLGIAGGIVTSIAVALLVERAPAIAAWSAATARAYSADTVRWIAAWTPEISPDRIAEIFSGYATYLSEQLRWIMEWRPPDLSVTGLGWVASRTPIPPPIRVAVNSDPWSHVEVDGVAAGPTPLMIDLAPGSHRFRAAMADGRTVERELRVTADRNRVVLR